MRRNEISSHLYEVFSDNSFCVLVSLIPNATDDINPNLNNIVDIIHPMCYEMFCSENSLTIKIKEQYIVCPRQGGKIKIGGEFKGYLFCPDYNLICTGTSLCNDMYDCAKNHSSIKDQTYSYDYEIATSQIQSELKNDTILRGFEVTNKGICKIDCSQCYKNGTCIECRENYFFVADFFGQNITDIKCKEMSVSSGYYYVNSVYYPCLTNCDKCTNDSICMKCMPNYYFIGNNRSYCDTGKDLAKYYTEVYSTHKEMVSALTYPGIITIFSIAVVTFIIIYVLYYLLLWYIYEYSITFNKRFNNKFWFIDGISIWYIHIT